MELESVFSASSRAIFDVLNEAQGNVIPAYQRGYAWDASNVTRLFEDVTLGLASLAENPLSVRFLGSIIAINEPPPRPANWPRTLFGIIDGQQRLCTIVVLNILIHDRLRGLAAELNGTENDAVKAVVEETKSFLDELATTFEREQRREGSLERFYPRIIRALDDNWATTPSEARYSSPIARFIWEYIRHVHDDGVAGGFTYEPVDADGEELEEHAALGKVIAFIGSELDALGSASHETFDLPDARTLRTHEIFTRELWQNEPPEGLDEFFDDAEDDDDELNAVERMLRLTSLARFVNFRMAATLVEAKAEDYAFDMFEALNTTGQPLTAFETFKPKVVEAEGADYLTSPSRRSVARIESYLNRFTKAEERQAQTSTLLIPFALTEDGRKLEKHLSYQRRYLRDSYRDVGDVREKRRFVRNLASVATFVGHAWRPPANQPVRLLPNAMQRDEVAEFCFEVLRWLKHDITLAPLARYYSAYERADRAGRPAAARAFYDAVKAVTAFSMIWRANYEGTAGVDGAYRELMASGVGGSSPLCRRPATGTAAAPTVANLRRALLAKLRAARITRANFIRDAGQSPILWTGQGLTRFFLLTAAHNTVPDPDDPGMLLTARRGTLNLMTPTAWNDDTLHSVEHVAPDSRHSAGWSADLYEDQRTVQRLGNFVLIPDVENNVLGNRPWAEKRVLYRVFGATRVAEAERAIRDAARRGFNVSQRARELVEQSAYLPMCASIKDFAGDWDAHYVARRSAHLFGRAWDRIYPWLDPTPTTTAPRTRTRTRRAA